MNKFIIILIILATLSLPKISFAQFAVEDVALIAQAEAMSTSLSIIASSQKTLEVKEFSLDQIAYSLAKMVLRELTTSVVNWINSGFNGNPAFVSNPGEFFKDIGDQTLGQIIEGSDLNFMCSPFSIDLRLALAFKYRPFQKRISCTLTDVIKNSTGAVENASINGFTAGDFSQGGWPAFVSMTTEPQNNIYGAYVEADYELSARVARNEALKRDELNQGRGFLSWKKCDGDVPAPGDYTFVGPVQPGEGEYNTGSKEVGPLPPGSYQRTPNCEVQTPGSVIAGVLDANTTGPLQDLHLADELNEVVNALFAQMVKQVLTTGLKGLSGQGPSDPNAYIEKLQQEQTQNNQQLNSLKDKILKNIDTYINTEVEYKSIKDTTLNYYVETKSKYDSSKTCFITKLNDPSRLTPLNQKQIDDLHAAVGFVESRLQTYINTPSNTLFGEVSGLDQTIYSIKKIKTDAINAKTVNDISDPLQKYTTLEVDGSLHTKKDIDLAKTERDTARVNLDPFKQEATRLVQQCSLLP